MQQGGNRPFPRFYQFNLVTDRSRLFVVPGLLENAPYAPLFNGGVSTPLGDEFRQFFISQVPTLVIPDLNGFFNHIPGKYLVAESDPEEDFAAADVNIAFFLGSTFPAGRAFSNAIEAEAKRAGSTLPPVLIVDRSWNQDCGGCHVNAPVIAVPSIDLLGGHIDERVETRDGVTRYAISETLRRIFAPNRATILADYLSGKPMPVHSNGTIGGGRTSD